ncbi:MAG: hypothetical protein Q9217_004031 [Psora testacea]
MADPFSIIVGTAGILDISFRLCRYLKNTQAAIASVEGDLTTLLHEIEALIQVNESIQHAFATDSHITHPQNAAVNAQMEVDTVWQHISTSLTDTRHILSRLEELLVTEVIGKEGLKVVSRWDGFKKQLRKQSKDEEYQQLRRRVNNQQGTLQVLLGTAQLLCLRKSQSSNDASLTNISDDVRLLSVQLKSQLASLNGAGQSFDVNIRKSLQSAAMVASSVALNKHFTIPQTVSSIYTGRRQLLWELKNAFASGSDLGESLMQKRFVIYGLGGSGKTQFSCKFAQDNRQTFWGVFWIDASSRDNATHSYNKIARVGGVESNVNAAKSWLSGLDYPWLLVIDSADDSSIAVDEYFPEGERGHILITTRNPALRIHGTVGMKNYHFERLEDDEASHLVLKAAGEPTPWKTSSETSAALIAKTLGCLPLALVHAGKAVLNGLCTLSNYLNFYERNWQRLRSLSGREADDSNLNVYSSYEIIYQGLETCDTEEARDAIHILKTLSFMHWEGVKFSFFVKAAEHPRIEQKHQENMETTHPAGPSPKWKSWAVTIGEWGAQLLLNFLADLGDARLPAVLRRAEGSELFDELRLRLALKRLAEMSLVTQGYGSDTEVFSMHPLVHKWVRDRPQMSTAEQSMWCQLAATLLAQCILLPPLGASEEDEDLRRDLLPHLDQVRTLDTNIRTTFAENLKARRIYWPAYSPAMNRAKVRQMAKFSRVYSQCGRWTEAERLQSDVNDYLSRMLGSDHPYTIDIRLALSNTYWQQSKLNAAGDLQDSVLKSCVFALGHKHHKTLKVKTMLGVTREYQGRFTEALALHEDALRSFTETLGEGHEDTLNAIDNLGRINWRYFRYDKAAELHSKAVDGMKATLGCRHLSTLTAAENLAMTRLQQGGNERLIVAQNLLEEVHEQRKTKLGKESPYTLLAICNLARVKSALGKHREAEQDLLSALPIAERNLGPDHIGVLAGRYVTLPT